MTTLNKVAGYRTMLGFKQKDMAKALGITVQSYGNKERGYRPFTDEEKIIIKNLVADNISPSVTIDSIFFN